MKILAIRGRNLASLAGDFALDFTSGPLSEGGLFAITGPTGAGKSTLLDALCLALFDRTPRLDFRSKAEIGRGEEGAERLLAHDVRSVLTRGKAEGYAQVDFADRHGKAWRATWRVNRARNRPTGALQGQTLSLVDLATEQAVPGSKTEVLDAISERLGLTFDQFRKSVLLAQGGFAEFLKADANERSRLLQRMTGDEVYERISRAAFARAREVRAGLERLRAELGATSVLTDAERRAAEEEARAATGAAKGLRDREKELESVARLGEAEAAARSEAEEKTRSAGEAAEATREAASARGLAADALGVADAELKRVRDEEDALRGELDRSRELDVRLAEAESALAAAEEEARRAASQRAEAERAVQERDAEEGALAATLAELDVWLGDHAAARPLVERWDDVVRGLAELASLKVARADAVAERERAAESARHSREEAELRSEEEAAFAAGIADATAKRTEAERLLSGIPAGRLRSRADALAAYREALASLEALRGSAETAAGEASEAIASEAIARAAATANASEAELSRREAAASDLLLGEAREALRRVEAALGLEVRRTELVPGEPCPLCGSTEHPWASQGAPGSAALAALRSRAHQLERERDYHRERASSLSAAAGTEAKGADAERARAARSALRRDAALAGWRAGLAGTQGEPGDPLPPSPLDGEAKEVLAGRLARAREEASALAATLARSDELAEEVARLRGEEDRLRGLGDAARARREASESEARAAQGRCGEAVAAIGRADELATRETDRLGFVVSPRPELATRLASEPGSVGAGLQAEADSYRTAAAQATAKREALAAAAKAHAEARAAVEPIRLRAAEAAAARDGKAEALGGKRRERASLLGGRSVAEVEAERSAARSRTEKALEEARAAAAAAGSRLAAAGAAESAARAHASEAAAKAGDARAALESAASEAGLSDASPGALGAALADVHAAAAAARQRETEALAALHGDDGERAKRSELEERLAEAEGKGRVWLEMDDLLGSADGKKLRVFAQSLTLEALVQATNRHLADLARRYRLERVPGTDMELQVVDSVLGDERRSVQSLSGGETFLVSLALALGLSSLATRRTKVETLFVDEGFGTLDADTLDRALAALEALHAAGRRVGVISHVVALTERIGTRVAVVPRGAGKSVVTVEGAG